MGENLPKNDLSSELSIPKSNYSRRRVSRTNEEMPASLNQLRLAKGHVYETILSTYGADGKSTAAPMGVIPKSSRRFVIRIFKGTLTFKNLLRLRCGVANLTNDPVIFYKTAFKQTSGFRSLEARWFEKARTVKAPRLRSVDASIEFKVDRIMGLDDARSRVICEVEHIDLRRTLPTGYCRGAFAAIECIIHATRIQQCLSEGRLDYAEKLIALVSYYKDLAERVSPSSKYVSIIRQILGQIDKWRESNESLR